jgi:beta-1,4-N-acetylglucosaminyltransferase
MKICLVCSHGGHLTQMLRIRDAFSSHKTFLITYKWGNTQKLQNEYSIKTYLIAYLYGTHPHSIFWLLLNMIIVTVKEIPVFLKERPDAIVSTGSEIAIPICYIAKLFGKRIVYIETFGRPLEASGTAKFVYPIADLFLVQWEPLLKKFKRARYEGRVFL